MNLITLYLLLSLHSTPIEYRQLTWNDYKKVNCTKDGMAAQTVTELDFEKTEDNGRFYFSVKAYFLPDESYTATQDEGVLAHENTHFMIEEYFARYINKALHIYQGCPRWRSWDAEQLYDKYARMMSMMQKQFDRQSDHGRNSKVEAQWEDKIKNKLLK